MPAWVAPTISAIGGIAGGLLGGNDKQAQIEPWGPAQQAMQYGLGESVSNYNNRGQWTPEQEYFNNALIGSGTNLWNNNFGNNYIPNSSMQLAEQMRQGQFAFNPQAPGQITAQQPGVALNEFEASAQGATYDPTLIWGTNQVNAQQIDPRQFSDAGMAQKINPASMNAATMQAAQNQGYTPTGQVKEFMEGGAYDNKFLDGMYNSAARQLGENFNENIVSGITDREVGSGQYGGSRGAIAEGIAARGQANALGDLANNMYGNAYNQGFGAMADLTGQQMAGDINRFTQNTNNQQSANQYNAGQQQQRNLVNSGYEQQAGVQNAANNLTAGIQGQQNALNAMLANQSTGLAGQTTNAGNNLTTLLNNQGAANTAAQFGAGNEQQAIMANQNINADVAGQNASATNEVNAQNANRGLTADQINARNLLALNQQNQFASDQNLQQLLASYGVGNLGYGQQTQLNNMLQGAFQTPFLTQQGNINQLAQNANAAGSGGQTQITPGLTVPGQVAAGLNIYDGLSGILGYSPPPPTSFDHNNYSTNDLMYGNF